MAVGDSTKMGIAQETGALRGTLTLILLFASLIACSSSHSSRTVDAGSEDEPADAVDDGHGAGDIVEDSEEDAVAADTDTSEADAQDEPDTVSGSDTSPEDIGDSGELTDIGPDSEDAGSSEDMGADVPIPDSGALDILFVIDNSGSMLPFQTALAQSISAFLTSLEDAYDGRPNLHVGVVSTDAGAGPWPETGCSFSGDRGRLRLSELCGSQDLFVEDIADMDGDRLTNYEGSLVDVLECAVSLGVNGCGFEQQLESMRLALDGSNEENTGFLREGAMLLVVILSDEDDCSAASTDLYDTTEDGVMAVGPLGSFRCFEHGVLCDPDVPRTLGEKTGCTSRTSSTLVRDPQTYVEFLRELKPPGWIYVATLQGDTAPVEVVLNEVTSNPNLDFSCTIEMAGADPGIRLAEFSASFSDHHQIASICEGLSVPMSQLGTTVGEMLPR